MKYLKQYPVLVACALVIILSLVAVFVYPLPAWAATTREKATADAEYVARADGLAKTPIQIPTLERFNGAPDPKATQAKKEAIEAMEKESKEIVKIAGDANRERRVIIQKDPRDPTKDHYIPVLNPKNNSRDALGSMDHLLPKIDRTVGGNPERFRREYINRYNEWLHELNGRPYNSPEPIPGNSNVPIPEEITRAWELSKSHGNRPPVPGGTMDIGQADNDFVRDFITKRANDINVYVDPAAFFRIETKNADEARIFEACVETWFQNDVVSAIVATNAAASRDTPVKGVAGSAVKRLIRINIGTGATGGTETATDTPTAAATPGSVPVSAGGLPSLFLSLAGATSGAVDPATGAATTLDFNRSMTGRVGSDQYDVVGMVIQMDIDPAYLIAFIDNLYRQNNGYTVLNLRWTAVDPIDAASNGYLYGNTQVVRATLRVEGLLFRGWTVPLMPEAVKTALHVPAPTQ